MDDEDLDPRARLAPSRALSSLSVAELRDYEERLLGELETVRETISAKQSEMSAAESLFKSS